jgi:hypothetical protein
MMGMQQLAGGRVTKLPTAGGGAEPPPTIARLKVTTVEVWQYWPDEPIMQPWVANCTKRQGDELRLVRRSGAQLILPGEWLVRNLDGDPEWMPNADFRAAYEVL